MNADSEIHAPQRRIVEHPIGILLLGSAVGLSVFFVGIALPRVEVGGVPYVVLILLSLWFPWRHAPLTMAIIGSSLTVGSYTFAAVEAARDVSMVNLGLDLSVLWVTAYLVFRHLASQRFPEDPEGHLRALVNTAVDGVIIIDASGGVQIFNPACEKLFGYSAGEVSGRNVSMLMPAPYKEEHDGYLARYRETGERRIIGIGREVEGRRRDGSTFPLELSVGETRNGDQGKLRQVLINLLGNAVKFTPQGSVRLLVTQTGDMYRFEVTDTGSGIAPGERERIFKPFQQADEGFGKGGTGLGLTLSKRQVELMGGKLEATSQAGEGSQFAFDVALPPAEGPIAPASLTTQRIIRLAPECRVEALVVDDVADNRELLTRMLQTVGAHVSVAEDGVDALEKTRLHRPDIIFMDVRMPVMDGMEALRHIREETGDKRIVCVALSAAGWGHETRRYFEAGFDDFIAKPYRFETVCERIEKHLGVRFEREAAEPAVADRRRNAPDLSAITLPEALRQRLLSASRINAFTEIEAVLAELKDMGGRERELAEHLLGLLQRYDGRAIADTMETLLPQPGDKP